MGIIRGIFSECLGSFLQALYTYLFDFLAQGGYLLSSELIRDEISREGIPHADHGCLHYCGSFSHLCPEVGRPHCEGGRLVRDG